MHIAFPKWPFQITKEIEKLNQKTTPDVEGVQHHLLGRVVLSACDKNCDQRDFFPAGVMSGQHMQADGKGAPARNKDGVPGNLMMEFQVERHPIFTRSNWDILMTKSVDLVDALLGTVIRSSPPPPKFPTPPPTFTRSNWNVLMTKSVDPVDALLGKVITVTTPPPPPLPPPGAMQPCAAPTSEHHARQVHGAIHAKEYRP